jgi:hypothetical protein
MSEAISAGIDGSTVMEGMAMDGMAMDGMAMDGIMKPPKLNAWAAARTVRSINACIPLIVIATGY